MILQWTVTNTEDDLKGYNVYVAESNLTDLQAKVSSGFFKGLDLSKQQVRRCKETSDLFSVFGFKPDADQAKKDCDDFIDEDAKDSNPESKSGAAGSDAGGTKLTDGEAAPTFVKCRAGNGADVSASKLSVDILKALDVEFQKVPTDLAKRVGLELECRIPKNTKLSDGKTGFANGKSYVAFVVAVKGDDSEEISYTSNFVEDSPAVYSKLEFTGILPDKILPLSLTVESEKVTGQVDAPEAADLKNCTDCGVGDLAKPAGSQLSSNQFAIAGDSTGSNSKRLWLVGSSNVGFLSAKPRNDYANGREGIFEPGDSVLRSSGDGTSGYVALNQHIVPGALFYVRVGSDSSSYNYGKLYFQTLTVDAEKGQGFTAFLAIQPTPGSLFAQAVARISNPARNYLVK